MASEPTSAHCFVLGSFKEFEALARRALHEGELVVRHNQLLLSRPVKCCKVCLSKVTGFYHQAEL